MKGPWGFYLESSDFVERSTRRRHHDIHRYNVLYDETETHSFRQQEGKGYEPKSRASVEVQSGFNMNMMNRLI